MRLECQIVGCENLADAGTQLVDVPGCAERAEVLLCRDPHGLAYFEAHFAKVAAAAEEETPHEPSQDPGA